MRVGFWNCQQGAYIIYWCCWLTSCHRFHEIENVACKDEKGWHEEDAVMWGWCGSDVRVTWRGWCVVRVMWGLTLWTGQIWQAASLGGPSPPCKRYDQEGVLITNVQSICKKYICYTNVPTYPYTIHCIYWILTKGAEAERKRKGGESRVTWQRYSPRNLVWDDFFFNFLIS